MVHSIILNVEFIFTSNDDAVASSASKTTKIIFDDIMKIKRKRKNSIRENVVTNVIASRSD